uniref:Si:dkey-224e22.2 n=1 Tax=Hucho hucho TaxID=62062 RepID=A0A4W5NP16_9TELE
VQQASGTVPQKPSFPGFFQGRLYVDGHPRDTFIRLPGWSKGVVFINWQNLGRHRSIGPQQTLYLPGHWLKSGNNQVQLRKVPRTSKRYSVLVFWGVFRSVSSLMFTVPCILINCVLAFICTVYPQIKTLIHIQARIVCLMDLCFRVRETKMMINSFLLKILIMEKQLMYTNIYFVFCFEIINILNKTMTQQVIIT